MRFITVFFMIFFALLNPVRALDLGAMSPKDRDAFGDAVRTYLLDHPQVLIEALTLFEHRQQAEKQNTDRTLIQTYARALNGDDRSWVGGNVEGDITVIEFIDYRCGYCKRAYLDVKAVLKTDKNVRLILKEFPILGPQSELASRFAIAIKILAGDLAYKKVHDNLMAHKGGINQSLLDRMASDMGQDQTKVRQMMQSDKVSQTIDDTRQLARALQLTGTPAFIIGDQILRGYVPLPQMIEIIANERENAS